jgi:hypothetical protein
MATLTTPQPLHVVYLKTPNLVLYETVKEDPAILETWLVGLRVIVREGSSYEVPSSLLPPNADGAPSFNVMLSAPHSIGVVVQNTEIILGFQSPQDISSDPEGPVNGNELIEELSIDEDFLANSVLHIPPGNRTASLSREVSPMRYAGKAGDSFELEVSDLRQRISHADDHTIYLHVMDLKRLGLVSGGWVSFISKLFSLRDAKWQAVAGASSSSKERLLQVSSSSDPDVTQSVLLSVPTACCSNLSFRGRCLASPVFLHNLHRSSLPQKGQQGIYLRPHTTQDPVFSTVTEITLSPVACSLTTLKRYEKDLTHAVKKQMTEHRRLLQVGDLIPVKVNPATPWSSVGEEANCAIFREGCALITG